MFSIMTAVGKKTGEPFLSFPGPDVLQVLNGQLLLVSPSCSLTSKQGDVELNHTVTDDYKILSITDL